MTMTTGEAIAVHTVLHTLLGTQRVGGNPTEEQSLDAAALLADRANRTLSAGLDGAQVRAAWPRRRVVDRTSPEQIKADNDEAVGDAMALYRQLSGAPEPGPDDVALPLFDDDTPASAEPGSTTTS